jgi:hypothetical protein
MRDLKDIVYESFFDDEEELMGGVEEEGTKAFFIDWAKRNKSYYFFFGQQSNVHQSHFDPDDIEIDNGRINYPRVYINDSGELPEVVKFGNVDYLKVITSKNITPEQMPTRCSHIYVDDKIGGYTFNTRYLTLDEHADLTGKCVWNVHQLEAREWGWNVGELTWKTIKDASQLKKLKINSNNVKFGVRLNDSPLADEIIKACKKAIVAGRKIGQNPSASIHKAIFEILPHELLNECFGLDCNAIAIKTDRSPVVKYDKVRPGDLLLIKDPASNEWEINHRLARK